MDDKIIVIFGVLILGLVAMFYLEDPASTIDQIVTGLFGIAVGRNMR